MKKKKCIKVTFSFQGRLRLLKLRRCLWCVSEEVTGWVIWLEFNRESNISSVSSGPSHDIMYSGVGVWTLRYDWQPHVSSRVQ